MSKSLPPRPSLEHLKKQAKLLLKSLKSRDTEAIARFRAFLPRLSSASDEVVLAAKTSLQEAQLVVAREYGFDDWQKLAGHVDPDSRKPKPHRKMIVPREWHTNTPTLNYETGDTAMSNDVWQILTACHDGELDTVRELLDENPELISCEYNYTQPIHFAVREGHLELTKFLLDRGADVAYRTPSFQDSLLTMACDREYLELADLIEQTLAARFQPVARSSEVLEATAAGDARTIVELLDSDPAEVNATNESGHTALHIACDNCRFDIVRILVERGADVDADLGDGVRPIHRALYGAHPVWPFSPVASSAMNRGRLLIAGYLFGKGSEYDIFLAAELGDLATVTEWLRRDPTLANFADTRKRRPISGAVSGQHVDIVRLLLQHGADPSLSERGAPNGVALWIAVALGHSEIVRLLLDHGADSSASVESSGSVLSASRDKPEIQEMLLSHGATEEMSDLEQALMEQNVEAVERILEQDSSRIDQPTDMWGEGLLSMAANRAQWKMLELLCRYGATVPNVSKWGKSYYFKHYEVAKHLLEQGMNANHINWHRTTLLHDMAMAGEIEKAELLLDHGAEIDAIDDEYRSTPLGLAARRGHKDMVALLLRRGADPKLSGAEWSKPVAWALRYHHREVAALLKGQGAGGDD